MKSLHRLLIAAALLLPFGAHAQGVSNVAPIDCSGTITVAATAQVLSAASATLHGIMIADTDTAKTEGLWVSFTGTAAIAGAGSYYLTPYAATAPAVPFVLPLGAGFNGAISIFGTTLGHKFSCTKW